MFYDDLNTSGGQSGSPVFKIVDEDFIIVGIHVGYSEIENANVAVVLTPALRNWIEEKFTYLDML